LKQENNEFKERMVPLVSFDSNFKVDNLDMEQLSANLVRTFDILVGKVRNELMESLCSIMLLEPFSATHLANYLLAVSIHPTRLIGYHTVRLNYPPFVYAWISYYEKVRRGEIVGQVLYPTHFLRVNLWQDCMSQEIAACEGEFWKESVRVDECIGRNMIIELLGMR